MSSPGNATVCHGIIEDLDITGIGVRSTFYVTSFLLVVNACIPGCDVRGPFWTLLFTNQALLVSALIQAVNKTISLYNATIVLYLCYLHSCSSFFVLNILRWVHRKNPTEAYSLLSHLQLLVLVGFSLFSVIDNNGFGSQPECNSRVPVTLFMAFWCIMILILFLFDITTRIRLCGERISKRISHIIGINDEVQTFLRNHEWKVGLTFFVVVWVSVVVSIEKTMLISSVIHSGPRFTASFGQIFPIVTIGIPIFSIYSDARAWLRRRIIKGTPPMAVQDTPNMSAVVYNNDAYLAYVMTVDEESLGADATPALLPADTEIAASTITTPASGDEIETPLDIDFGNIHTRAHSNTTPTLPPTPATGVTEISSQALRHRLGTKENQLSILGEVDVQTHSCTSNVSPGCVTTQATTSNITTPSGEERETKLNTELGRVGEVDVQTHASTSAVSLADTETITSTITVPPGDEMETTRTLDVLFGQVDMQTHSHTTSTLPPAASVAEVTTSITLPNDEGGPILDVIGSGQTGEVDVRAPDSETKTPEHKVPTATQIDQLGSLADFLRGREFLHRREALRRRES